MNAGGFVDLMLRRALAVVFAVILSAAPVVRATAATPPLGDQKHFDIASQPLPSALLKFADQSGVQITSPGPLVEGKKSGAVEGTFYPREALALLLEGTALDFDVVDANTVVIRPSTAAKPSNTGVSEPRRTDGASALVGASAGSADLVRRDPVTSHESPVEADAPSQSKNADRLNLEEVVVTGSRLAGAPAQGPVPVNVYTHDDIARSGQTTVSDFLNTLPEVSTSTNEGGTVFAGQTSVRLRGLPLGTTLVLINGRRLESGGGTAFYGGYFDLNNIPAAVIDRIEIVPEGSSAVYGSDALAGVVNIILKKDFDGVQTDAHYGGAAGTNDQSADFAWGRREERGSFSVIGSYYGRSELSAAERSITSSEAYGPKVNYCNPGNVQSVDGGNLPGLGSPTASVRPGVSGVPTLTDFNASTQNLCRQTGVSSSLLPSEHRASVFVNGSFKLTPSIEIFAEVMYSHSTLDTKVGDVSLLGTDLPASNAFNPFGTDVLINYRFQTPQTRQYYDSRTDYLRPLVGARGHFLDSWEWEVAAWESRDTDSYDQTAQVINSSDLAQALAASNPATALNLFSSGAPGSAALLQSIYSSELTRTVGQTQFANAFVRGTVFDVPAGPVSAVLGGEYARSKLDWWDNSDDTLNFSFQRSSKSVFGEIRLPVLSARGDAVASNILALTSAVRYDDYSDFGGKVTPQYAVELRPTDTLLLRGAYARAFSAPGLVEVYSPTVTYVGTCCVTDPQHGGESVSYAQILGGNPKLNPQTGRSLTAGAVWSPTTLKGLQASLTYWEVDQYNRTTEQIPPQTFVNYPNLFPGRVIRDPQTGQIQSINQTFLNFGEVKVSGIDFSASYAIDSEFGRWAPSINATEVIKYEIQATPGSVATNVVSQATLDAWSPRWKGTAALNWSRGLYSASADARYVGRYTEYQDLGQTDRQLGNFWTFDMSARYAAGKALFPGNEYMAGSYLQLGAVNLFDSLPRYSVFGYGGRGFDPTEYDIRGRFVYINVGTRF